MTYFGPQSIELSSNKLGFSIYFENVLNLGKMGSVNGRKYHVIFLFDMTS